MDTVIKIILKDEDVYLGGDHLGSDIDKLYDIAYDIVSLMIETGIDMDEYNYLSNTLYEIDGTNVQDIELLIDKTKQIVIIDDKQYSFDEFINL